MADEDIINSLTSQWSGEFKADAEIVVKRIIDLIGKGYTAQAAINQAFTESDFAAKNKAALSNTLVEAAAYGYGITPGIIVGNGIVEKLNTLPWAPDNMPLSNRLHGLDNVMRATINDTIKLHMTEGTNVVKMARDLYDGYNDGKILRTADLPVYLRRLECYAQKSLSMGLQPDVETMSGYNQSLKRAKKLVKQMDGGDVPTKALKTAYKKLLEAAQDFSEKKLKKAVYTATQEHSRYFAERIARTEIARAWADGFYAETLDDPDVVAYRWKLSSRHPQFDICNLHASANLYGLGPGVYPKNKMPAYPAHPHCTCHLVEVFKGEFNTKQINDVEKAGRRYIKGLNESQQKDLLGQDGVKAFHNGEDWRQYARNWQEHEKPSTRLNKSDFNQVDYGKLFTPENIIIPTDKLLKYALNKEHKVGGPKAVAFEMALGYTKDNYKELSENVRRNVRNFDIVNKGTTKHGTKFEIIMNINGPNGKTANVITGWIIKNGQDRPSLTTIYVTGKGAGAK